MDEIKKDPRFSHIVKDPRFRCMKRKDRKVTIDKRFKGMFHEDRFKLKYSVDKRGRPLHVTTSEDLRRYYDISGSESDDEEEEEESKDRDEKAIKKGKAEEKKTQIVELKKKKQKENKKKHSSEEEEDEASVEKEKDEDEDDDSDEFSKIDVTAGPDYARGEGDLSSSSEEDEDVIESEEDTTELPWGEIDHDAPETDTITHRLAVCNMDWDRIKAQDLMVLFNSFKPPGGIIRSVTIYPSEFGTKRMKEEELKGPTELVTRTPDDEKAIKDEEEYHKEKLRIYQLNRLKYYYGVIECDSKETANHIYEECDGIEYMGSSNRIDLRFIPDDMTFDQEPREQVFEVPDQNTYKPSSFISSALQQTKVNLTWDETDPNRTAITMRKFTKDDLDALDVQDYLASDSGEDEGVYAGIEEPDFESDASNEEDEEAQINKYRALLQGLQDSDKNMSKDKDMEMEISWEPGLKETTEDLVKKSKEKHALTPWEKYLDKSKKKKMEKKINKSRNNEDEDTGDGISDDDIPSDIDLNDPYFKEELDKLKAPKKSNSKKKKKEKLTKEELEKQQQEEAELELLMSDDEGSKRHFNLKELIKDEKELKGKKKRRMRKLKEKIAEAKAKKEQDDFQIDTEDPRFKELYENPLFNIDPTAPEFKRTKATEKVIEAKLKRRMTESDKNTVESHPSAEKKQKSSRNDDADSSVKRSDPSLATLIKSVKAKTKSVQEKKKKSTCL